jgi:3-hydroxybutyryl-CoA dehydrogenase
VERLDPRTLGIDMLIDDKGNQTRVRYQPCNAIDMRDAAHSLARDGKAVSVIRDSGGFRDTARRSVNCECASDICQQGICTPSDLETAVTLGLAPHGTIGNG